MSWVIKFHNFFLICSETEVIFIFRTNSSSAAEHVLVLPSQRLVRPATDDAFTYI